MRFTGKRIHHLLCLLFLLISFQGFSSPTGEESKDKSFLRIDESLNLMLHDELAYLEGAQSEEPPVDGQFKEMANIQNDWMTVINRENTWLRIILHNPSESPRSIALKTLIHPGHLRVFHRSGQAGWDKFDIGILVKKDPALESYYPTAILKVQPGIDTIYVYCVERLSRFSLFSISVVDPEMLLYDRGDFIASQEKFVFILYAFVLFLVFQIFYVAIQFIFHQRKVYREYILYLVTVLVYFTVRLEIYLDFEVLTGDYPWLRRFLNDLTLYLPFAFYLRFARYFLEMPVTYPEKNRIIKVAESIVFLICLSFTFFYAIGYKEEAARYLPLLFIPQSVFAIWLIVFFIRQSDRQIRFLMFGSLFVTLGHALAMSISIFPQLLEFDFFKNPLLFTIFGLAFEIFFFNTGLGYKAKYEQEEKIKAQQKLIGQMQANEKMQSRLQGMRNKIASDLHDDVGSTLSSIGLYSEVGAQQIDRNPEFVKGIFDKITSSSQRMMTAMSDIVWAVQSFGDSGEKIMERLTRYGQDRLQPADIKFKTEYDQRINELQLSIEARRNILLLFKEAVNNAAKYSHSLEVEFTGRLTDDELIITIRDYGDGFNYEQLRPGNGLTTMKRRARELGGTIFIESTPGTGTSVIVHIPLSEVVLISNLSENEIN